MAKKSKEVEMKNIDSKEIEYGDISKDRELLRKKARKSRRVKSRLQIIGRGLAGPFVFVYRKIATYQFIFSRDSRKTLRVLGRGEASLSQKAANLVTSIDRTNEGIAKKGKISVVRSRRKARILAALADENKVRLLGYLAVILIASMGVIGLFNHATDYEYSYNGRVLGIVKNQQEVTEIMGVVNKQLTKEYETEVSLSGQEDIKFRRVVSLGEPVDNTEAVLQNLTYMRDIRISGYGIFVNGKRAAVLNTKKEADKVLEEILMEYSKPVEGIDYEKISFMEKVSVEATDAKLGNVQTKDVARNTIMTGAETARGHLVEPGDTITSVAEKYGITTAEIEEDNVGIDRTKLPLGEAINISTKQPLVSVEATATANFEKEIEFKVVEKQDGNLYKDVENIDEEGQTGIDNITAKVVMINGEIVREQIITQNRIREPRTQVVRVGTKALPPTIGSGDYINPFSAGRITSPFGIRFGGEFHPAIDLAGAIGSPIIAADGGTVIFAGYDGAYGNKVEIDHGGGIRTVYAHCSKLIVGKGEKVYRGREIAKVGSTGRSTGPHVHFELRMNGTAVDPAKYI